MALDEADMVKHLDDFAAKLREAPAEVYGFVVNIPCEPHEVRDRLRALEEGEFVDWRMYAVRKLNDMFSPLTKQTRLLITTDMIGMRKINEVTND